MNICKIEGCEKQVKAFGYCQTHWMRLRNHGSTDKPPVRGDGKRKHPLYVSWSILRSRHELCEGWLDFWNFQKDVGERPGPNFNLARENKKEVFSKANFYWQERLIRQPGELDSDWNARRWDRRIKEFPTLNLSFEIYRIIGLKTPDLKKMLEKKLSDQDSKCAICGIPQSEYRYSNGTPKRLHLDHCHKTGKIREFLCGSCNHGIGNAKESIEILEAMIEYIKKHS